MLLDRKRTLAYRKAIRQIVRPGDRVVDIGTGTGILSLFAAQAGAARVYAIDQTAIVPSAKETAIRNGFGDRIRFIRGHSLQVDLPERCNVLVTETMGSLGFDEDILNLVLDARKRFLTDNARIIPCRLSLFVVPVMIPSIDRMIQFWSSRRYGYDLSAFRARAVNTLYDTRIASKHMLASPAKVLSLKLRKVETPLVRLQRTYTVEKTGKLTGIAGWFEAELTPGLTLSNAPGTRLHWKQMCFPVDSPVPVRRGDRIRFALEMVSFRNRCLWNWSIALKSPCRGFRTVFQGSTLDEYLQDLLQRKSKSRRLLRHPR